MKRLIPILLSAAVLVPLCFMHSCANTTQAPSGGLKDTIPPYISQIVPPPMSSGVPTEGSRIVFTFNEYVTIKTATNIFLSPPQSKAPKSKIQGKNLVVYFEEPLQENTTYTLTFTDAIADANEGNMFPGYTYVFSTGSRVDTMMITGTVQNCNTLAPVKGATVLLYKDHSDSAVFLRRPYAAAKTDDWGYFHLPYIKDTLYRLYAIKDEAGNNIYDPDTDLIGFVDSLVRPVLVTRDTMPEMLNYEMKDTVSCQNRKSEYELNLFREKPSKQFIVNKVRTAPRAGYITFMAPNAWVDSMWVAGFKANELISEFNIMQDSLAFWINSRRAVPDTMHLFVSYRKTDSLGILKPFLEHVRVYEEGVGARKKVGYRARKDLKHEDTICVAKLSVEPDLVEQQGFSLEFNQPIINGKFDSIVFRSVSPRQKVSFGKLKIEQDSLNLRRYILKPEEKLQVGYDYFVKIPHRAFRDINGFRSDSTEVKVTLPTDEKLTNLTLNVRGVDRKYIVDLLDERGGVKRTHIITQSCSLKFPYLKEGKYMIRFTDDGNRNSIVDTGSILEHRQPEKVRFLKLKGDKYILVPESAELTQDIDLRDVF